MSLLDSPLSPDLLRHHPQRFERLLGLSVDAFDTLFEKVYIAELARQKRLHPLWTSERVERMVQNHRPVFQAYLVITLFYLRQYPLQEVLAASFGLSQGNISKIIDRMSRLLEQVLPTPEVTVKAILAFVQSLPEEVLEESAAPIIIDATEQRIERSGDPEKQRADYSGKKNVTAVSSN